MVINILLKYPISIIIPDNIYNSIFHPFIKSNNNHDKYSSGLGLYICQEIVNDNNGLISIENGEIVTVTITFFI